MMKLITKLLDRFFERHDITRTWTDDLYLTRWILLGKRFGEGCKVFLHQFHRSDYDTFHDHPWDFTSVILWGGYWENTPDGRKWYRPGRILRRPATWRHKVEIPEGKTAWTLIFTSAKVRSWGFWCPSGWIPWRQHASNMERTGNGCE